MSIIIVGVGQAEFDGESSSTLMLPKRLQALGNDPAPKSVCSRLGVCDCFGELAGCDSVFVCIGVCMLGCAPHTHVPRRGGRSHSSLLHPWEPGEGWGAGTLGWAPLVSWLQFPRL